MSQHTRDLRNAALYFVGLLAVAGGLVIGGVMSAKRVDASSAMQVIASAFDGVDEPAAPTRLSVAVANAREIRAALDRPIPPLAPLPPITARLARGDMKPSQHAARPLRMPKAALDAMASADIPSAQPAPRASLPRVELHRVY